jgi:hypothetical protein
MRKHKVLRTELSLTIEVDRGRNTVSTSFVFRNKRTADEAESYVREGCVGDQIDRYGINARALGYLEVIGVEVKE